MCPWTELTSQLSVNVRVRPNVAATRAPAHIRHVGRQAPMGWCQVDPGFCHTPKDNLGEIRSSALALRPKFNNARPVDPHAGAAWICTGSAFKVRVEPCATAGEAAPRLSAPQCWQWQSCVCAFGVPMKVSAIGGRKSHRPRRVGRARHLDHRELFRCFDHAPENAAFGDLPTTPLRTASGLWAARGIAPGVGPHHVEALRRRTDLAPCRRPEARVVVGEEGVDGEETGASRGRGEGATDEWR